MREKIGPSLIVGISGTSLTANESDFLVRENIGGVILFKRNFESPEQLRELCDDLQSLAKRTPDRQPFFIAVDQEGGRVARFRRPFTEWPPMAAVGKIDSATVAFKVGQAIGAELHAAGVNMNFAPSVDILTNPANTVIGDRALSTDADAVAKLGSALVRGYIKSGVIPVAKHFPGHGNTLLDSHDELPIENRSRAELNSREWEPFKRIFRARLSVVMSAHIKFPEIDPDWPATLSEVFLKDILRTQLHYRGIAITYDLDMKALTKHHTKAAIAVRAIQAGANMLLYCNEPESPLIALDAIEKALRDKQIPLQMILDNQKLVLELKRDALSEPVPEWSTARALIGCDEHQALSAAVTAGTAT